MIQLYYTYRIYKKFSNPVLGRRKLNQAGFFNLKIRQAEEVIGLNLLIYLEAKRRINETFRLVANRKANNLVQKSEKACHLFDGLFLFRNITNYDTSYEELLGA